MDIGHVVLKHTGDEPVAPEQEDFGLVVLGHKVDTLVSLGHRDILPNALGKYDFRPANLGH